MAYYPLYDRVDFDYNLFSKTILDIRSLDIKDCKIKFCHYFNCLKSSHPVALSFFIFDKSEELSLFKLHFPLLGPVDDFIFITTNDFVTFDMRSIFQDVPCLEFNKRIDEIVNG